MICRGRFHAGAKQPNHLSSIPVTPAQAAAADSIPVTPTPLSRPPALSLPATRSGEAGVYVPRSIESFLAERSGPGQTSFLEGNGPGLPPPPSAPPPRAAIAVQSLPPEMRECVRTRLGEIGGIRLHLLLHMRILSCRAGDDSVCMLHGCLPTGRWQRASDPKR